MWNGFLFGLGLALAAVAVTLLVFARRHARRLEAPPEPVGPWEGEAALRRHLEQEPETRALYRELGYDLDLEWRCAELLAELEGLVRTEIPDPERFRAALDRVAADLDAPADPALAAAREEAREHPLLQAVLAARDDPDRVRALLDRDPVGETLPFVERIPILRGEEVIWRTPVEIDAMRKRPRDPDRFARILNRLDRLVRGAALERRDSDRRAALDAIARAGRDLRRERFHTPTSIQALRARLGDWLERSPLADAPARRRELDALLQGALALRHHHPHDRLPATGLGEAPLRALRDAARGLADRYLRRTWWRCRPLDGLLLHNLLVSELAAYPLRRRRRPATPGGVLALVCAETAAGRFDGEETARRLHALEDRGVYVHSLVFALLRDA